MKTLLLIVLLCALTACGGTTLHKPTTACNAGTSALVAYGVAGHTAGKYFALKECGTPAVQPCKLASVEAKLHIADDAAYNAAIAADNACDPKKAENELGTLNAQNAAPEVKNAVDSAAKARSKP